MIANVGATNTANTLTPIQRVQAGRRATAVERFAIPQSPLRSDETKIPGREEAKRYRDSVEFTQQPAFNPLTQLYAPQPATGLARLYDPAKQAGDDGAGETADPLTDRSGSRDAAGQSKSADESDGEKTEDGHPVETDAQGKPLDEQDQKALDELKSRDREVRQHEQAHKAAGGNHAGAISYEFQQGPDGKRYAVGGEVSIDVSKEKDPAATAAKMRQVRAAALAPAEPSGQDRQVAAQASQLESEARAEMRQERMAEASGKDDKTEKADGQNSGDQTRPSDEKQADAAGATGASGRATLGSFSGGMSAFRANPYANRSAMALFGRTPIDIVA